MAPQSQRDQPLDMAEYQAFLREIGYLRAVGPLIKLIDRGHQTSDAANALKSITGEDFGEEMN